MRDLYIVNHTRMGSNTVDHSGNNTLYFYIPYCQSNNFIRDAHGVTFSSNDKKSEALKLTSRAKNVQKTCIP